MTEVELTNQGQARGGVQVIGRAAAILRVLRDDPGGMSLGQIAERVHLARSTVQRIVSALQQERLVITLGTGGIRLGPELVSFAASARFNVVDTCRPILADLSKQTGETADLSVLRSGQMIFLDQASGTHRLRTVSAVGEAYTLTDTASGRAVLADLPRGEAEALALAEWGAEAHSAKWPLLSGPLDRTAQEGLAYDLDDHTVGISAIGFAFRDWSGMAHAISIPVPSTRFTAVRTLVSNELLKARERLLDLFVEASALRST
jgi:DNA-binding IclR family transcriptional regulator